MQCTELWFPPCQTKHKLDGENPSEVKWLATIFYLLSSLLWQSRLLKKGSLISQKSKITSVLLPELFKLLSLSCTSCYVPQNLGGYGITITAADVSMVVQKLLDVISLQPVHQTKYKNYCWKLYTDYQGYLCSSVLAEKNVSFSVKVLQYNDAAPHERKTRNTLRIYVFRTN